MELLFNLCYKFRPLRLLSRLPCNITRTNVYLLVGHGLLIIVPTYTRQHTTLKTIHAPRGIAPSVFTPTDPLTSNRQHSKLIRHSTCYACRHVTATVQPAVITGFSSNCQSALIPDVLHLEK